MYESILGTIESLQSTGCKEYPAGLFPSQRVHTATNYCREDNNIFFSTLIVFTLQQLRGSLPQEFHPKVDDICRKVVSNFPRYQHYADKSTYNFWQGHPMAHFPNGHLLKRMPFMALPADSDDTSMVYLADPGSHSLQDIKRKLESHYHPESTVSPLTPADYMDLSAYPTFLGRKIKPEYDVCVICNILYMVLKFDLKMSKTDYDSIEFIRRVMVNRDYHQKPFSISPNYNNSAVILYHIARLVGSFEQSELETLKQPLMKCLDQHIELASGFMESLLIRISLLRLGLAKPSLDSPYNWPTAFKDFYFFQAGMLTGFQKRRLNKLAAQQFFHLKYRCEAYYRTLWLEYKVMQRTLVQVT